VFEGANVNKPNALYLKNSKSGHYLQAVDNTVVQNPKKNSDDFIWQIIEDDAQDTSKVDTSVVDTGKTDSTGDTSSVKIVRLRDTRVDLTPARTFDLKGRSIGRQPLGRSRNTHKVLFKK
jgi:hypothetical protein